MIKFNEEGDSGREYAHSGDPFNCGITMSRDVNSGGRVQLYSVVRLPKSAQVCVHSDGETLEDAIGDATNQLFAISQWAHDVYVLGIRAMRTQSEAA